MKVRLFAAAILLAALVLVLPRTAVPGPQQFVRAETGQQTAVPPLTLNINLGAEPATLDPALAADDASLIPVEQLFIGLVDLDDETSEVKPELATTWSVSEDGRVYTFNLRSDILWSDGTPVTAHDVEYGILRSLDPAVASRSADLLNIIENAQAYKAGVITDTAKVGVTALSDAQLQITLHEPAAYAPSILAAPVARPIPQAAIETWGEAWTEPEHIVTNGPYLLGGWVPGEQITMTKKAAYYDAANVQIERINMHMVEDSSAAWQMYLDGSLDLTFAPYNASFDPIIVQEIQKQITPCTYYYGFVNTKPPFDDVRVRQAFAMSVRKENIPARGSTPANQFAPPGIWGAPELGSVGLPTDPPAARALLQDYLAEKGLSLADFNALDITLMYNTSSGHAAVAAAVQQEWLDNLGVTVILQDLDWSLYVDAIRKSTPLADAPHIYRMGKCADYADENNWVYEFFNNQVGANRLRRGCTDAVCTAEEPLQFEEITQAAKVEQDPVTRKALYRQAEQLLAEEEAAYLPLYFYGSYIATKAYLQRTDPAMTVFDIAGWRITRVDKLIDSGGGTLTAYDGSVTLDFPPAAYAVTAIVSHTPATGMPPDGDMVKVGRVFDISAVDDESGQPLELTPEQTYTMTVSYEEDKSGLIKEDSLALYYWHENQWTREPSTVLDKEDNTLTAAPNHHSLWVVLGELNRVFLPSILSP